DPEGERAERAVGRGMTVAAHDGEPGLGQALLRTHDVNDALAWIAEAEDLYAVLDRVALDRIDHGARFGIGDGSDVPGRSRHVMVGRAEGAVRPAQLEPFLGQHLEGPARAVVDVMPVDVEQRL